MSERLKSRRLQLAMSQEDVALIADITQGQVSRYERGVITPPADILARLALALKTSTDWLSGLSNEVNEVSAKMDISDREMELLRIYRKKSPETQQKLLDIARML